MSAKFDFKTLDTGFTAEWPVKVNVPADGGAVEEKTFTAVFRTPTPAEAEEQAAVADYMDKARLAVRTGFVGLGKGEDEALTPELKDKLLGDERVWIGLMRAYGEFRQGSPAKN